MISRGGIGKTYTTHIAKRNAELWYKQTHMIHDGFVRVHVLFDTYVGKVEGNTHGSAGGALEIAIPRSMDTYI